MAVDQSFLGTGWAFPPEFDQVSKNVRMVAEEDDIRESLTILLGTSPGERIMQPTYGCALRSMVFETITESTLTVIKDLIERAILFFEARITLTSIDIDTAKSAEGRLSIALEYTIRATNSRSNMVYPFYFGEGTDIRLA